MKQAETEITTAVSRNLDAAQIQMPECVYNQIKPTLVSGLEFDNLKSQRNTSRRAAILERPSRPAGRRSFRPPLTLERGGVYSIFFLIVADHQISIGTNS